MNFRRVNNLTGWLVFLIAFATYFLSREARGSLWDCGEFVSCADKMQLPHPPGAPLFVLLGRFFIILFGDNKMTAANAVNFMSALASAATILFLFWSITHFARKMFVGVGEKLSGQQLFTTMAAGVVGGLAYTFSDSFWFSAVEGEVYALSSFFTALVFWAMLKWEHADEHAGIDPVARAKSDRWIIFLFFMMGLSIGVHLLNLLSIPAIVMIYFFRRNYKHEASKAEYRELKKDNMLIWTVLVSLLLSLVLVVAGLGNRESDPAKFAYVIGAAGFITALIRLYMKYPELRKIATAFFVGCIITGLTQLGVIQYSMKAAGEFDVFFKNSLGMPFFSGFAFYFLAVAAVIVWALRIDMKKVNQVTMIIWFNLFMALVAFPFFASKGSGLFGSAVPNFLLLAAIATIAGYLFKPGALRVLKLCLWSYAFMMLGYLLYLTAIIRSNSNPAIDMNNVDNPINLVYYLSREQYGDAPHVIGPHFAAEYDYGDDGYVKLKEGEMKFVKGKNKYIPIGRDKKPQYKSSDMQIFPRIWDASNDQYHAEFYADWLDLKDPQTGKYIAPSYGDNINWFFTYQMGLMYWRYFMWNFSGKQNDIQGLGNKRDGNWISGFSFIDNARLGDQDKLPDSIKNNKAHNRLFLLPFLLGMLGCVYQFLRNRKDWFVNFLLFFMTGIAVVIYLNQPGNQPRERDYAYVGSFYAFAIWIGLAVVAFVKMAKAKTSPLSFREVLIAGSILTFLVTLMSCANDIKNGAFLTSLFITALFAAFTAAITYLVRAAGGGQNERMMNIVASVICLAAPVIMAQQEWDDHDRSKKTTAPDMARDYLESCAPNAVLFTFGDNDTYPLWYAQEVEGVRPDIRVINNSLLGIDWYINQLRYKVNGADSLDVLWTPEQIEGHNREYLRYKAQGDPNEYYDLYDVMKNVLGKPSIDEETGRDVGFGSFPVAKFRVPVDTALVRSNGTVNPDDAVLPEIRFEIPKNKLDEGLVRSDFIILNFIASNKWKRPVYFTSPFGDLGFGPYLRKDGMSYRLVPVFSKSPQENWVVHQTMRKVGLGGTQIKDNNNDVIFNNLMTKFAFGAKAGQDVYFDEENRRHLLSLRELYGEAAGNLADAGKTEEAKKLLDKVEQGISPKNLPYAMVSRFGSHNQNSLIFLEACYKAGKTDLAEKYRLAIHKDLEQQRAYYLSMNGGNTPNLSQFGADDNTALFKSLMTEYQINEALLEVLSEVEKKYAPQTQVKPAVENPTPTITNTVKPDTVKPGDSNR